MYVVEGIILGKKAAYESGISLMSCYKNDNLTFVMLHHSSFGVYLIQPPKLQ